MRPPARAVLERRSLSYQLVCLHGPSLVDFQYVACSVSLYFFTTLVYLAHIPLARALAMPLPFPLMDLFILPYRPHLLISSMLLCLTFRFPWTSLLQPQLS